ncbi:MAG: stage III sporulation protein AE [Lachnospiraceae bacterium]|nr:stage III sporulation protein AE [Lachnospiraceae bacterium]
MIKKLLLCIFVIFLVCPQRVMASESKTLVEPALRSIGIEEISSDISEITDGEMDFYAIVKSLVSGDFNEIKEAFLNGIKNALLGEVNTHFKTMKRLVVIALLGALLKIFSSGFSSKAVGELGFYVCYIVIITIITASFSEEALIVSETASKILDITQVMLAAFVSIALASGNIAQFSVTGPIIIGASGIITSIISSFILPAITLATTFGMINCISEKNILTKFSELMKDGMSWILKGSAYIFMAVVSLCRFGTPAFGKLADRAAKTAIGVIPVVGNVLNGAFLTAAELSKTVGSSMGVAAIIFVVAVCITPVLKLSVFILLYKLTAALIEPICEERIIKCLGVAADFSIMLLGALVTVITMFVFSVIIMMTLA